jgi:hypothetical protein
VLDIFGFEIVDRNGYQYCLLSPLFLTYSLTLCAEFDSLEQLCINVANEQLQNFFNKNIFEWHRKVSAPEISVSRCVSQSA